MSVIQGQFFHSFSFVHWDIFFFSGEEFSFTSLLFMPLFSDALHQMMLASQN